MEINNIKDFVELMLESEDFETLLERFNLTPNEVFIILYEEGHIDDDLLTRMSGYE